MADSLVVVRPFPLLPSYGYFPARARRGSCRCYAVRRDSDAATPPLIRAAVGVVTEILRVVSSKGYRRRDGDDEEREESEEIEAQCVDDIVSCLKRDYECAYFLTGNFTSDIYSKDCLFEDPTISFRGRERYSRNLELLVPFFDCPSLTLEKIEKGAKGDVEVVIAAWKLRTYLKLPWRPFVSVDGSTTYYLNAQFQIVRHVEAWNVSALEAIGQLVTPRYNIKDPEEFKQDEKQS